jgi:DegV family protein with EDD domain
MIIITDSAADISLREAAKMEIKVVTMDVMFPDGSIRKDGVDITPKEFYQEMEKFSGSLPRTSQPSPSVFERAFLDAQSKGESLLAVLLSGKLSGTMQSARMAADQCGNTGIHLIDSGSATLGEKLLIRRAVELRSIGLSAAAIETELRELAERMRILAVVDSLKHLHKGGRLPAAAAVIGGALGIKPIISLQCGDLTVAGKARGRGAAYKELLRKIEESGGADPRFGVEIGYTDDIHAADPLRAYAEKQHLRHELTQIGAVIGTHIGPGAAGIAFVSHERRGDILS